MSADEGGRVPTSGTDRWRIASAVLTCAAVVLLAGAEVAGVVRQASRDDADRPRVGDAQVWYVGHCGYVVRTARHLLVFDCQERRDGPQRVQKPM